MDRNATTAPATDVRARAGAPTKLLAPGTCVADKYVICDVLGTGGAAVVYAAEQLGLKRVVAFKLYPLGGIVAERLLERFEREAQLLARVHHENVVSVFDAGSLPDGSPYLVVQRLLGDSLASRLVSGPLPVAEAVDLTQQLLNALSALADAGIAHRDVKPANLVLDRSGEGRTVLKLVDFGIAKEIAEGPCVLEELLGTPNYMAPEQVRGEQVDERCDLYAAGATLYEMLTGCTPHRGQTVHDIVRATLFGTITPVRALRPDCPAGLERIVMKALARDRTDRFACARAMKGALERWQATLSCATASELSPSGRALESHADDDTLRILMPQAGPKRGRRRRGKTGLAAALGLAALVSLMFSRELASRSARSDEPWQAQTPALHAGPSLAELLSHARASADQLLAIARRFAPGWSADDEVVQGPAQ